MNDKATDHRLDGLEPDNLLAILALLGLLRALEAVQPAWRPRARWEVDAAPLRPVLVLHEGVSPAAVCDAAAEGVALLAARHSFGGKADLNHTAAEARTALLAACDGGAYEAALLASLCSDVAVKDDKDQVEATPLCLLFGQGHQHFLKRLAAVPQLAAPPARGRGKKAEVMSPSECVREALFSPWTRQDPCEGFRWDRAEDVRYALQPGNPSKAETTTQHGANRLAAIGLATLTAAPRQQGAHVRLAVPGGGYDGGFRFAWPIWREAASLLAIRAMLGHPLLREPDALGHLSVIEVRETRRISVGKFMNFTVGRAAQGE